MGEIAAKDLLGDRIQLPPFTDSVRKKSSISSRT